MGDPTKFEHYARYPMCGFCTNAWDIIYQRMRTHTNPEEWLNYCPVHGCDPDVWDYINLTTHWPKGWKVFRETGMPNWKKMPPKPTPDDRVFHKRATDGLNAKWRRTSNALLNKAQDAKADHKMIDPVDLAEWDDADAAPPVQLLVADLDDDDLW